MGVKRNTNTPTPKPDKSGSRAASTAQTQNQSATKLFKLIASQGGRIVFDQRLEAATPREAREKMKATLGVPKLTGIVYAITEIPLDLLRDLVTRRVLELVGKRTTGKVDVSRILAEAAKSAVADQIHTIEQRIAIVGLKMHALFASTAILVK
jgi:hypothetical protein